MTIFSVIFILGLIGLLAWVVWKMIELDERQEELDKYSVYLDERANKLALWEHDLMRWERWNKEGGK